MIVLKFIRCVFLVMTVCPPMCVTGVGAEIYEKLECQRMRIVELEARLNAHDTVLQRLPQVDGSEAADGFSVLYQADMAEVSHATGTCDCPTHCAGLMATTFFRPDRTVVIWSIGKLTDDSPLQQRSIDT